MRNLLLQDGALGKSGGFMFIKAQKKMKAQSLRV